MKNADLEDNVIMQDTTQLAFYTVAAQINGWPEHVTEFIHAYLDWTNPEDCAKDMISNVATILYSFEHPSESYYKYTN